MFASEKFNARIVKLKALLFELNARNDKLKAEAGHLDAEADHLDTEMTRFATTVSKVEEREAKAAKAKALALALAGMSREKAEKLCKELKKKLEENQHHLSRSRVKGEAPQFLVDKERELAEASVKASAAFECFERADALVVPRSKEEAQACRLHAAAKSRLFNLNSLRSKYQMALDRVATEAAAAAEWAEWATEAAKAAKAAERAAKAAARERFRNGLLNSQNPEISALVNDMD